MALTIAGVADVVPGTVHRPLPDSPFFAHTGSADLTVANLEVPLTARLNPLHEGIVLHAPESFALDLPRAGITVASLANNHVGGHGLPGIEDTLAACERAGVRTLGFGSDRKSASAPLFVEAGPPAERVRVAVVAATCVGPRDTFAADGPGLSGIRVTTRSQPDPRAEANPGIIGKAVTEAEEEDLSLLEQQVAAARQEAGVVVAVLHWGLGDTVLDYMRAIARRLIDAGASVVFGHHTHQLAAVDWYRQAPIFYGLGSFIFQYDGEIPVHIPRDAAVARVVVDPATGAVEQTELIIGRLDPEGVPQPAGAERVERVVEDVMRLSALNPVAFHLTERGCLIAPA